MRVREDVEDVTAISARSATRRIGLAMGILMAVVTLAASSAPAWAVTGGVGAAQGEYPSVVAVEIRLANGGWVVGGAGALLDGRNVLTSGYLVKNYINTPDRVRVRAGRVCRSDGAATVRDVVAIDVDTAANPSVTLPNDIGILHLESDMPYVPGEIEWALLPTPGPTCDDGPNYAGQTVSIVGWGRTSSSPILPECLQQADIAGITMAHAETILAPIGAKLWPCHLPMLDLSGSIGSALRDQGGPVFAVDSSGNTVLIGIQSWFLTQSGVNLPTYPSVATRVACYLCWIKTHRW